MANVAHVQGGAKKESSALRPRDFPKLNGPCGQQQDQPDSAANHKRHGCLGAPNHMPLVIGEATCLQPCRDATRIAQFSTGTVLRGLNKPIMHFHPKADEVCRFPWKHGCDGKDFGFCHAENRGVRKCIQQARHKSASCRLVRLCWNRMPSMQLTLWCC